MYSRFGAVASDALRLIGRWCCRVTLSGALCNEPNDLFSELESTAKSDYPAVVPARYTDAFDWSL